ncbi:MAG: hypothetical protein JOY77_08550 [Alphaproteobacteria bacterium]|nr:hypothetical protein [Alphaproteobacteria bacterium]
MLEVESGELIALKLLAQKPNTKLVPPHTLNKLIANGLAERRVTDVIVTSRGHAVLLAKADSEATS